MRRGRGKDLEVRAVAARLRSLRLKRGLTQWAMADRGLSYKYYQRIEAGRANVTIRTLARVAQALGVPFDELFRFGPHRRAQVPKDGRKEIEHGGRRTHHDP